MDIKDYKIDRKKEVIINLKTWEESLVDEIELDFAYNEEEEENLIREKLDPNYFNY